MTDEATPLARPEDVIPHRAPFLFLDEVTLLVPNERAEGYWQLTGDEAFFAGHFPERPTLPGVLMTEAIAQLGAYAVLASGAFEGRIPMFGALDKVKWRRQVVPGERLDMVIEVTRMSGRAGKATGTASVDGELACKCELMFVAV